jgi:sodium transport system ATP-binding protein
VRSLRELLQRLRGEGHCVLFSSHVMAEVAVLCDEVVVIGSGRVLSHGTPEEIRTRTGTAALEEAFVALIARGQG